MARPTTRAELIDASESTFAKLDSLVASMTPEQRNAVFPFEDRDRCVRDVLMHLHEWHLMLLRWYTEGEQGITPAIPGEGYSWRTLPDLNREIWKRVQDTGEETAERLLAESHRDVMATFSPLPDEQLFTRGVYSWTKSSTLGAYVISSTSSHYNWALKKLRKAVREWPKVSTAQ